MSRRRWWGVYPSFGELALLYGEWRVLCAVGTWMLGCRREKAGAGGGNFGFDKVTLLSSVLAVYSCTHGGIVLHVVSANVLS